MTPPARGNHVVLLHGWASHTQVFHGITRALEHDFRVHVLSLPGYNGSAACAPYTLERITDTLAANAPRRCSVVGWSLGAQAALSWAHRAPAQVSRIALIGATPCFAQRPDWPHAVSGQVMRQFTEAIKRDRAGVLRRFVALQSLGDAHAARVAHKLRTALFTNPLPAQDVLENGLEILRTADLREILPWIRLPALIVHGEHDAVTPCAAGRALSEALPDARFHAIAGAGHAPFLSAPNAVVALLHDFLDASVATIR